MNVGAVRPQQRIRVLAVALLAMIVLCACGARIDTVLSVNQDGSGERTMVLTYDDGIDKLAGGSKALDASIRRHLPAGVEYGGVDTPGDDVLQVTLTVPFESPADYRDKMAALMNASDYAWDGESYLSVQEERFVEGIDIHETFKSSEILGWLFNGLLVDGVVEESNASNMYEDGDSTVEFGDVVYSAQQPIRLTEVVDRGFSSVEMSTDISDDEISRTITYTIDQKALYTAEPDRYDSLFTALEAEGFVVDQNLEALGVSWNATITAGSAEKIAAATNTALLSEETAFVVTREPSVDHGLTELLTVTNYASCAALCSPDASDIIDVVSVPSAFDHVDGDASWTDQGYEKWLSADSRSEVFAQSYQFTEVSVALDSMWTGGVQWVGTFALDAAAMGFLGEDAEALFMPIEDVALVEMTTEDESTIFSVSISGGDVEEFLQNYQAWSATDYIEFNKNDLDDQSLFKDHYWLSVGLPLPANLTTGDELVQVTATVPWPHKFESEQYLDADTSSIDGGTLTFVSPAGVSIEAEAGGLTLVGMVAIVVLTGLLLAALAVLVIFRKQIAAASQRRAQERRLSQPAVAAGVVPHAGDGVQPAAGAGSPSDVAQEPVHGGPVPGDSEADYL